MVRAWLRELEVKVYRLYREANLAVCRRRKAKRPPSERIALSLANRPNAVEHGLRQRRPGQQP